MMRINTRFRDGAGLGRPADAGAGAAGQAVRQVRMPSSV